jgi:hypothetical protein
MNVKERPAVNLATSLIVAALLCWCLGHPPTAGAADCPNEAVRASGLATMLPDCRGYELVSAAESNGRLVESLTTFGFPTLEQVMPSELVSPSGDSAAFLIYQSALPSPTGASGVDDVYVAERGVSAWETTSRLTPAGSDARIAMPEGLSPDQRYGFAWINETLDPLQVQERLNLYLVGAKGKLELAGTGSLGSEPYAMGRFLGENGQHIIFSTGRGGYAQSFLCARAPQCAVQELEPDAAPTGTGTVYDREAEGETHVVSLLPGNVPQKAGEEAYWKGTSKDGSATAFEVGGVLYIRLDNEETKEVAAGEPIFAGVSDDGGYVFYVVRTGLEETGVIHRFDTATGADGVVNPGDEGLVVNVSGDGSHVYFISEAQLDAAKGTAGEPNLYVWSGGSPEYVATVLPSDLSHSSDAGNLVPGLANWTDWVTNKPASGEQGPGADSSRTSLDGTVIVFESKAKLTSYENEGHTEIYRYVEGNASSECVSCNLGREPEGQAQLQDLIITPNSNILHNLSEDGSRVFFETDEALVPEDIDGVNDAYEWSEEEGAAKLISSGKSSLYPYPPGFDGLPTPNVLFSITPDGSDVLFISQDALVPGAPEGGASAIYDARVGGGFPLPPEPVICVEEGCKPGPSTVVPFFLNPPSESAQSSGNVKPKKHKRPCQKSKHKKCPKHTGKRRLAHSSNAQARSAEGKTEPQSSPASPTEQRDGADRAPNQNPASIAAGTGSPLEYGLEEISAELSTTAAGMHPDFTTNITLDHSFKEDGKVEEGTIARTEEVKVSIPPGLIGNINAVPRCTTGQLVAVNCPTDSQVGIAKVLVTLIQGELNEPLYNLAPPHPDKEIARLGFTAGLFPAFIDVHVRTDSDFGVTATAYGTSGQVSLVTAKTTLWGNPANKIHDKQRLTPTEATHCKTACEAPGGERPSTIPPADRKAFMTNPSACQPGQVDVSVKSYQFPDPLTESAPLPDITDCAGLPFAPSFEAEPTSHAAGAPTGLHTKLVLPQHLGEGERSTATMREARVTLPAGMQVAAGAANWIGTCSEAQVGYREEVDAACPDSSKLGTAKVISPALPAPIEGSIYQRAPAPGRQFGLWLAVDALGLHVKLPGELEPDKQTGRLTAVFREIPQVPAEEIDIDVWGGPRAPLQNPDRCGSFATDYAFSPHSSDPAVTGQDQMQVTEGCSRPFSPTLRAGVTNPTAGAFSPFVFDLSREDGQQALRGFELHLPEGAIGKPKGVPLCPDADANAGACPAGSRIGSLQATAGPGPEPFAIPAPGKPEPQIYFSGPYEGAPFSIVTEAPAQAGPFDLGVLAVRSALQIDPETARATVKADPLPQFFEGVGIDYRHLHAVVDRPEFFLNPTNCGELAVTSDVASTTGTVAHPQARFQVDGCKALKFKPKLSLKLRGGTKRAQYPALTAILKARKGDANVAFASVALPHSEFLAQEHIGTICTRKQFAADKCPKKSVYGKAKAWTPLLDEPLSGPVYLRSSDHPLPDLVAKLGGQLEIDLAGRIDSAHGGIRSTFESVPDAPVSKFVLQMRGGKKGLLTNSTDVCRGAHRATVRMRAQNGRTANLRPRLIASSCGKKKH